MDSARELAQGKVAMVFLGPWILRWLKDNTDASTFKDFAIAEHPQGPSGRANAFLQNFVVPKASEHPKEALDFARYMSSTALDLAKLAPVLPPLVKQAHDPYLKSHPDTRVLVEQQPQFYWPLVPQVAELFDALRQDFQAALLGQKSAQDTLGDAADKWNQILSGS
jgi:putative chitobiose transport system substrate-binding protein